MKTFSVLPANHLDEIYQNVNLKFAFADVVNGNIIQQCDFVKCRDFLNDAVISDFYGINTEVYGFTYDVKNGMSLNKDRTYLIISGNENMFSNIENQFEVLRKYEKSTGIRRSILQKVKGSNNKVYLFVTASKIWSNNSVAISYYSLLLRVLAEKIWGVSTIPTMLKHSAKVPGNGTNTNRSINQVLIASKYFDVFVKNPLKLFTTKHPLNGTIKPKAATISADPYKYHNNSGIKSFFNFINGSEGYSLGNTIHTEMANKLRELG